MILTIFKKELKDTLRDRRTIIAMIVIPVLIFPIILGIMTKVSSSFAEQQMEEVFDIAVVTKDPGNSFVAHLTSLPEALGPKKIHFYEDSTGIREEILKDSLQLAFFIPQSFEEEQDNNRQSTIEVILKETNTGSRERAETYIRSIEKNLTENRLNKINLDPKVLEPLSVTYQNLSSDKEMIGKIAGGILPYLFIIFGFIGCLYPAIDLFTGEKERKTLETLLTTPLPRWKILTGKMLVVVLSGVVAATFALIGLFLSLEVFELVDNPKILEVVRSILSIQFIGMLYLLLIPLTIFFAGMMIPVTIYAKSFKEAQSILTPVNFIVILPAMVGFLPGIELNFVTAFIPIVNIVLASKDLVAGNIDPLLMFFSFMTMLVLAFLSVLISYKRFGRETNIIS
ncbi:MAG: ABC transporter permease subunit [Brumimicrobium sp.]|nr:ABC transporter permease subunit [Brumimicrobium sp.]